MTVELWTRGCRFPGWEFDGRAPRLEPPTPPPPRLPRIKQRVRAFWSSPATFKDRMKFAWLLLRKRVGARRKHGNLGPTDVERRRHLRRDHVADMARLSAWCGTHADMKTGVVGIWDSQRGELVPLRRHQIAQRAGFPAVWDDKAKRWRTDALDAAISDGVANGAFWCWQGRKLAADGSYEASVSLLKVTRLFWSRVPHVGHWRERWLTGVKKLEARAARAAAREAEEREAQEREQQPVVDPVAAGAYEAYASRGWGRGTDANDQVFLYPASAHPRRRKPPP